MAKLVYQRKNGKWEARYRKCKSSDGKVQYGTVYGDTEEEAILRRIEILGYNPELEGIPTEMNLLIIGAGIHGRDCKEIADSLRIFKKIRFLDDVVESELVIGKMDELDKFRNIFPCAFIAIGDNEKRMEIAEQLKKTNYIIPNLISPYANISSKATVGDGIVIFPQSIVNEASIGDFCIIDSNTVVNSMAQVGDFTRVDCGGMILKGKSTPIGTWIKSGEVYGK